MKTMSRDSNRIYSYLHEPATHRPGPIPKAWPEPRATRPSARWTSRGHVERALGEAST